MDNQAQDETAIRKTGDAVPPGGLAAFGGWAERAAQRIAGGFSAALLMLSLLLLLAFGVVGAIAYSMHEMNGLFAAIAAALVCWAASAAALFVTHRCTATPSALTGLLLSIVLRTGAPLAAAAILSSRSPYLKAGGVFGWFVVFYLISLAAETLLSVGLIGSRKDVEKAS